MKILIIALVPGLLAYGSTLTVCNGGCNYTTAQAALDASNNGDTIILTSGQNLGPLTIPGGRHDLTIKSSQIDTYPRGYRIIRGSPALARLTTITAGDSTGWVTTAPGNSVLTSEPGGVVQPHGLLVGDTVAVGGSRYSAYVCASLNQPPYVDGGCDSSRVGFMNIRTDTGLGNNSVLYFSGRTLPQPLLANTPYYIVNFTRGGSVANADKFQISSTAGGSPISIPQFNPAGQDLIVESRPLPEAIGQTMYVVSTPTPTTLQLSTAPGGAPTVWAQIPKGYNGATLSTGFSITKIAPVYNLTFDGIEVFPTTDNNVYYPFYISSAAGNASGENHNIQIFRCWIHGADDQESFPMATLNVGGRDVEIGWNVIENAYSTGNDTQGIEFEGTANIAIHDNEIKGASEGIMSGGNIPWFAWQTNTTGISVSRNYLWKPLKAYTGMRATFAGPNEFQLLSSAQGADCSTVASDPDLGNRCFAYEAQETPGTATPPSAPLVSRTEWTASAGGSSFFASGSAGQKGYIYLLGGVFHMDYNFGGAVSCPSGVTCSFVATPAFPTPSTRLGIAVIGSGGVFDGSFYQENRNAWSKNLIESKYGDNWLIEGNVFHRQSNCDGGSTCQDMAINFTVGVNGSGPADPVNYMASTSNSIIRNNIFRMLSGGIVGVGKSFAVNAGGTGLIWEWAGFGQSTNNQVTNNLFMDIGSTEYSALFGGAVVRHQNTQGWTVQHNTAVDVRIGFLADGDLSSIYTSNVATPYRSACPGGGCSTPAATSHIGVQNQPGPGPYPYFGGNSANTWDSALANGNIDATSNFLDNILMNRAGFVYTTTRGVNYPNTSWLLQQDDLGRDPNTLFASWQERDNSAPPNGVLYRSGNYRLAAGQAARYPALDARAIGADIDEIEAMTGRNGSDVENGWPTFAERTARTISSGLPSTISYLPNGSPCTIIVWPNLSYSGVPSVVTTDSGEVMQNGLISVPLTGLSSGAPFYGKRWCGSEVDVFTAVASAATAAPKTQFEFTTAASPSIGGTLSPSSGTFYDAGTAVSVLATANPGYRFAGFSGGTLTGSNNPQTVTMDKATNIVANFTPFTPSLGASVGGRTAVGSSLLVTLTLTNTGLGAAENARITGITAISDVAGAGAVTLASPKPVTLGTINPNSSATTTLTFNWPSTATRVGFTINFAADGGYAGSARITTLY